MVAASQWEIALVKFLDTPIFGVTDT